ncbi:hypothetical protein HME9304_01547 [Flagellimonas maritima]|uniref:Polysaccharide biosynthesis protein C-terminal domain-containing protein n=2 Tax=Flagellimonas maritima TaxID=1383885 RepID=A0A2Z4LSI7_9FLAO|nr:hypothetical protein HME9304_01547 [Allomuricauda aurantiaca]
MKDEYGSFRQIMYIHVTIISIIGLSLSKLPSNYLPLLSLSQGKNLINKIMLVLVPTAIIFGLLIYAGNPLLCKFFGNPTLKEPLKIFSWVVLFTIPTLTIEGIYATYKKTHLYGIYVVTSKVLFFVLLIIPIVIYNANLNKLMLFWAIHAMSSLVLGIYLIYLPFLKINPLDCKISYKNIFKFLVPLTLTSVLGILFTSSDQFYISNYFGEETYADFSNGSIKIPFIGVLIGSISAVLHPYFVKKLSDSDSRKEITKTIHSSILKSITLVYPIIIFVWFSSRDIFFILFGEEYTDSAIFFKVISIYSLFSVFVFLPIIIALKEVKFYNIVHVLGVLTVWASQWLILNFTTSPFVVPVISLLVKISIIVLLIYKIISRLQVNFRKLVPLTSAITLIVACVSILIPIYILRNMLILELWQNIIFVIISFIIYFSILFFTNKSFKVRFINIFKQFTSS